MKKFALLSTVLGAALVAGYVHAADAPATMPTDTGTPMAERKDRAKPVKLVKPYSDLKDLTPEQREKIAKVHADAAAEKKKIDDQETTDSMAVLTAEQKAEMQKMEDDAKMEAKEKKKAATSRPAK